jgi:hypothetical protein
MTIIFALSLSLRGPQDIMLTQIVAKPSHGARLSRGRAMLRPGTMSFPGTVLLSRFRVERLLAAREASESYLATDLASGAPVVLRVLRLRAAGSWKAVELLEREAQVLARLNHPGIPRLLACGQEARNDDVLFVLAREYVPGETLAERVARSPLALSEAASLGARVAGLLAHLHSRTPPVVHRDLKPSNLVLQDDGAISVIDFGAVTNPARTGDLGSTVVGTYGYMAPEQAVGDASPAVDLYALGATLLHAATGRDPASVPREGLRVSVLKVLPEGPLARLVSELLEPDPRQRPSSAAEIQRRLGALARAAAGRPAPSSKGPAEALACWEEVRAHWDEEKAHDSFIAWCAAHEELPFAGQCYRQVLDVDPDNPQARRGKERVVGQALALLNLTTQAGPDWRRIVLYVRAASILFGVGALAFAVYLVLSRSF